jgi:hypothetical protein
MNSILIEIEDTTAEYLKACNATSTARNTETALLNILNDLHKKFDDALKLIKEQSPRESSWKRSVTKQQGVAV